MSKTKQSKGLGDTVEKIIKATGLDSFVKGKDCGCKKRKDYLNEIWKYNRTKVNCMTELQYKEWLSYKKERSILTLKENTILICDMYASLFNRLKWYPDKGSSNKPLLTMIDKIDIIFDSYDKEIH